MGAHLMRAFFLGNAGDAARFGERFLGERGWCGAFLWVRGAGEPGDGAGAGIMSRAAGGEEPARKKVKKKLYILFLCGIKAKP